MRYQVPFLSLCYDSTRHWTPVSNCSPVFDLIVLTDKVFKKTFQWDFRDKSHSSLSHVIILLKFSLGGLSNISSAFLIKILPQKYSYLPTPPLGQDMTQGQFLSEV